MPEQHHPNIGHYSFGAVTIDGARYNNDVIIYPGGIEEWWRREGHLVQIADITAALAGNPDVLVIGTGHSGMMRVAPEVRQACSDQGVRLEIHHTAKACTVFNRLAGEGRETVIAALHLTC